MAFICIGRALRLGFWLGVSVPGSLASLRAPLECWLAWRPHSTLNRCSMESRRTKLATAILLAFFATGMPGCSKLGRDHEDGRASAFPLVVASEDLDLGPVWATSSLRRTIRLRNVSSQAVEVVDLRVSCGCSHVDFSPMMIDPGEFCQIQLTLDLSRVGDFTTDREEANFRTQLLAVVKGYVGPTPLWELSANVRQLVRLSTSFVEFETAWCLGQPVPQQTVDVVSAVSLASLQVESNASSISCEVLRRSDIEYALVIRPVDNLAAGEFGGAVALVAELATGEKLDAGRVKVRGQVSGQIEAEPFAINWGLVPVGRVCEARILVRSRTDEPFKIHSIRPDSEHIEVQIEASHRLGEVLLVKHTIVAVGDHSKQVLVSVQNAAGTMSELTVPLSYCGVAGEHEE